jgi:hypothetical protein
MMIAQRNSTFLQRIQPVIQLAQRNRARMAGPRI